MGETEILAKRAVRFREAILEVAYGPGGMINSFPRFDTRRPFQEGDFGEDPCWHMYMNEAWGGHICVPRPTLAEWWYGENTLWVTGWLLWSQMLRYQATQEPEALATARKCFLDLHNIFRLCREIEPGLLGKPHGGRAGPTTSLDQSACPVLFYAWYARDYATGKLKDEAYDNLREHGLYYLRRNMIVNQHGHLSSFVREPHPSAMKYLAAMYVTYELTGERDVRDVVAKYLKSTADHVLPGINNAFEISHNLFSWAHLCDYWSKTEFGDLTDWKHCIKEYWTAAQTVMDDEGVLRFGHYDPEKKSFTPFPDQWIEKGVDANSPAIQLSGGHGNGHGLTRAWVSSTSIPARAMATAGIPLLALLAREQGVDDQSHLLAKRTLLRLDEDDCREWWDDGKLPAELKPLRNIFAPEVAAIWLVGYWMGRLQKVW